MSVFNYKQRNNITLIAIIALGCLLFYALIDMFSAILGAIVLYTLFRPMYQTLVENRGWNKSLVATMIIVLSLVLVVIPFATLSYLLVDKIGSINRENFPIEQWLGKLDHFAGSNFKQPHIADSIMLKIRDFATDVLPGLLTNIAGFVISLLVMCFLLYFMFVQSREFEAGLLRYAPFREQHAMKFAMALRNATYSNVLGQGIISLVQGVLLANGFLIAGIPDPVFWGIVGVFISFLPVVGAPTMCIPAAAVLIINGSTFWGIFILVYGLVFIGNIDNVLRMYINKRVANTHPIISIIGVFIGIPLFGILGLVFGPVLLSYFLLLVEIYETNRMAADRLERIKSGPDL